MTLVPEGVLNACQKIFDRVIENQDRRKDDTLEAKAIIFGFYNSLFEKIKDINVLYSNKRYNSIELLSRSFFEQYIYARFILKQDTNDRVKALILGYYINSFKDYDKAMTSMEKSGKYELDGLSFNSFRENIDTLASIEDSAVSTWEELKEKYIDSYEELLRNDQFKPKYNSSFRWYNLDGKTGNFRELVNKIGLDDAEYDIAYKIPSATVHGTDIVRNVKFDKKSGIIIYEGESDWIIPIKALLVLSIKNLVLEIAKYYKVEKTSLVREQLKVIEISYKGIRI